MFLTSVLAVPILVLVLQTATCSQTPASPDLRSPPLSTNSTALKWEAPVPDATRAAAAGLLAQMVQLPVWRVLACDRLATPRLAALLNSTMQKLADAPGEGRASFC
jgi:hypothetical protein